MSERAAPTRIVSRRKLLQGSGALVVGFSLAGHVPSPADSAVRGPQSATPSGAAQGRQATSVAPPANQVDSWLTIDQDNSVTILSGRVELGTGVRTALAQIAADELYVPLASVTVAASDTGLTPDEGYTSGSKTLQVGGPAVRNACAEARQALLELAADRFG